MDKRRLVILFLLLVSLLISNLGFSQETAINKGISWLTVSQNEDGSWADEPTSITTPFHGTCTVANTLRYLGISDSVYSHAIRWITDQEIISNRYLSWKIEALGNSGVGVAKLVGSLVSYQNSDSGWGAYVGYESNVLDTTLALQALQVANYSDKQVIENVVRYLLSQQNRDGGWGLGAGSTEDGARSNVYLTSLVLLVLDNYKDQYNLHSRLYDGVLWLVGQQNEDGGFGRDGSGQRTESSVWETSLAYQALIRGQKAEGRRQVLEKALNYIENKQQQDGSWNNNAFETALALKALKDSAPDLVIRSEDVSFSPQVPIEEQSVTITAKVHNRGGRSIENVAVRLKAEGLSEDRTLPTIPVGATETISFTWLAQPGTHGFEIVVDPENSIQETNEENNSVYFFLTTGTRPDLTLSAQDITFDPPTPQVGDPKLVISANIYNKGESPADDFMVQLRANSQQLTAYNITTIPGGRYILVQALIQGPLPEGTYNIEVIIDPDNRVEETNETNTRLFCSFPQKTFDKTGCGLI